MSKYLEFLTDDGELRAEMEAKFPEIAAVREGQPGPSIAPLFTVRGKTESLTGKKERVKPLARQPFLGLERGNREAIIRRIGRPSLLISNDSIEMPLTDTWRMRLSPYLTAQEALIRSVGRVEVVTAWGDDFWLGTAWMIAPDIAVTNRHVAEEFLENRPEGQFGAGKNPILEGVTVSVDFREEYTGTEPIVAKVAGVLFAGHPVNDPDIAFLKLSPPDGRELPPPIPLFVGDPDELLSPKKLDFRRPVAVIGYPGEDDANDPVLMRSIFGATFEVKRYAPGFCVEKVQYRENWIEFEHDCTTLKGSSGSLVADIRSGSAVALHYQGLKFAGNDAVSARTVGSYLETALKNEKSGFTPLRRETLAPPISAPVGGDEAELERRKKDPDGPIARLADLKARNGYDPNFLGGDRFSVDLPDFSQHYGEAAPRTDGDHPEKKDTDPKKYILPYTNFAVVMHKARRLALFTAVNIDGATIRRIKREGDAWMRDPRIRVDHQAGNTLYFDNDYDKGHMVRRLDPVWGDDYQIAEADTFFYTNAAPQHKNLNQKTWLGLEDYLLNHADFEGFRACIFTGPVFRPTDQKYRDIPIPEEFWKVAVMVNTKTKKLHATGYVLSQRHLLLRAELFGQYLTSQRPLRRIEQLTGLSFGTLKAGDPLDKPGPQTESRMGSAESIRLRDFGDIVL